MRETRLSGSEGGGLNPMSSPYPYRSSRCDAEISCGFAAPVAIKTAIGATRGPQLME